MPAPTAFEHKLPQMQDDYVLTSVNDPVVVYPMGLKTDLACRGWEISLLNRPQGGHVELTSAGAVKFTPLQGFIGTATLHLLAESNEGATIEGTLTIDVQNQFAFAESASTQNGTIDAADSCSVKVFLLQDQPVFSGTASPNFSVIGRLYQQSGSLVSTEDGVVDPQGHWQVNFPSGLAFGFYRAEFEQVEVAPLDPGKTAVEAGLELNADEAVFQIL